MTLFFRFVLQHLPGKINTAEIEEMIKTVDKNNDGKISYSEFRVERESYSSLYFHTFHCCRSCWELFHWSFRATLSSRG